MRNRWLAGLASLLLTGGVALAQDTMGGSTTGTAPQAGGAATGAPVSKAQMPYVATRHVAVVNAGLMDATTNAMMLKDITQNPQSYDPEHGRIFVSNISTAISQAETHLGHLKPLATTTKESAKVQQVESHLNQARTLIPTMQASINDPAALNRDANQVMNLTRAAMSPLKDAAKALNAKVTFKSVG